MTYSLSRQAQQDIRDIAAFIRQKNPTAARQFIHAFIEQCRTLGQFPDMGRKRDELVPSLRSFPLNSYLIFYRPIPNGIEIARVVSGYRDLENLFSE